MLTGPESEGTGFNSKAVLHSAGLEPLVARATNFITIR